ncbi:hypothetical protein [Caminibacter sp.]
MRNYFISFFHIVIISIFLGCGYKAPPTWEKKKQETNVSDLQMIDINGTLKIKVDVK